MTGALSAIGGGGCGQGPFNEMAARAEDFAVPPRPARSLGFIPRSIQVTLSGHAAARGNDPWGSCDSLRGSEGVPSAGAWCFESVTLHGQGRATAIVRPVSSASATSIELQLIDDDEWRAIRETARP